MTLPRILRRFRRQTIRRTTWIVVAASVVTLLWVNGFHNIGAADAGSNESCVA